MIIHADARQIPLRDGCVQCVVTSPPYWGLRDYGVARQIGLEVSPEAYCAELVAVFREVRRVMADDATLWLNLGDSYANPGNGGYQPSRAKAEDSLQRGNLASDFYGAPHRNWIGLAPKNLVGIPWRVAFALQTDGWYLRSDIIWAKPNPMPESVTDRPTKSHEYLFLLAKAERYYYDSAAIAEPVSQSMWKQVDDGYDGLALKDYEAAGVQNPSSVKARIIANARRKNNQSGDRRKVGFNERYFSADSKYCRTEKNTAGRRLVENVKMSRNDGAAHDAGVGNGLTRTKRTVWTIPKMPYAGAHFATMPEQLVEPCILAGCPMGCLVLDPFLGSGTVGAVAERLGRRWVGCDLNPAYHRLARDRTAQRGIRFLAAEDVGETC